jgi:hypothetical protein
MELCKAHCYRQLDTKYHSDALAIYTRLLAGSPDDIGALEVTNALLYNESILISFFF